MPGELTPEQVQWLNDLRTLLVLGWGLTLFLVLMLWREKAVPKPAPEKPCPIGKVPPSVCGHCLSKNEPE